MTPKVQKLVWTSCLIVVTLFCAYLAWSKAADQEGFLGMFLRAIAFIFFVTSMVAGGCLVWIARSSEEMLVKPKAKPASAGATSARPESVDFGFEQTEAVSNATPRPAKKVPKAASKPPRPATKAPRPVGEAPRE